MAASSWLGVCLLLKVDPGILAVRRCKAAAKCVSRITLRARVAVRASRLAPRRILGRKSRPSHRLKELRGAGFRTNFGEPKTHRQRERGFHADGKCESLSNNSRRTWDATIKALFACDLPVTHENVNEMPSEKHGRGIALAFQDRRPIGRWTQTSELAAKRTSGRPGSAPEDQKRKRNG
jgi:hypothetical protein